ncbi:hypothetical protein H2201_007116 [Coniosporium apollinis]|uniref:Uncharacterized protein n=1 Tax=Coniosporium apollinis TaxID=61459 RepID=A0ABQ9NK89_9PEZI|nr:hypothetical protein H2201_007116 [Coniosporium apollinis]
MTSSPYHTTHSPPLNEKEFQEIERTWHNYCRYDQNEWGADEAIVFLDNNEALMKQCRFLSGKAAAKDRDVMQLSSENGSLKAQNELLKTQNKSMKEQIKSLQEKVRALGRTVPESLPSQSERVEGVGSAPGAEENRDTGKPDAQSLKKRKLNNG